MLLQLDPNGKIFDEPQTFDNWTEGNFKFEGPRQANGQKTEIVRQIGFDLTISEATYKDNRKHGLELYRPQHGKFIASIYERGVRKGFVLWDKQWNVRSSQNKEYCNAFFNLEDFMPQ